MPESDPNPQPPLFVGVEHDDYRWVPAKIVVVEADSLTIESGCLVFRATPPPQIGNSVRIVAAYAPWTWKSVWEAGRADEEKP